MIMKKRFVIFLVAVLICSVLPATAFAEENITFEPGKYLVGQDLQAGLYLVTAEVESGIIAAIRREIPPGTKENPQATITKIDLISLTGDEPTAEVLFEEGTKFTVEFATMEFTLIEAYESADNANSDSEILSSSQKERPEPFD
ncbi:MAG: hypothetical protein K6C08_00740, partial [Oscillospiraceae bacterium]|nr:hypothetical protein [Oscillospiraceae bacterium]